jgi:FolB domain-containing protein
MCEKLMKQLNISNYETFFILGNNDYEKEHKRSVILNICIRFPDSISCNDDINDTICYAKLINFLEEKLSNTRFNLIENAARYVYGCISAYIDDHVPESVHVAKKVEVIKPHPIPDKRLQSVSFVFSDWSSD